MKLVVVLISIFSLLSCASASKKYAAKVGCKEDEAVITEDSSMSMMYETYIVQCKGKTYKCTETSLGTSNCTKQ